MGSPGGNGRGYDRVELRTIDGQWQRMTRVEFEKMPLDQRVRAILGKNLRFYRGDSEITMREALDER